MDFNRDEVVFSNKFYPEMMYDFANPQLYLVSGIEKIAMLAWEQRNGWILNFGTPLKSALKF